jgi:hypothetical protein
LLRSLVAIGGAVKRGIDIAPYPLSHIAYHVPEWEQYVHVRSLLDGALVPLIELIPPVHQRVYRMGLEHLGVVVGDDVAEFSRVHRRALTGQQFQNPDCEPYYVLFQDFTHVKFYRLSLRDVCELEGGRFDGFYHVEVWVPSASSRRPADPLPR